MHHAEPNNAVGADSAHNGPRICSNFNHPSSRRGCGFAKTGFEIFKGKLPRQYQYCVISKESYHFFMLF
jgi:hypothetical protein